jgi:hypothetical protein
VIDVPPEPLQLAVVREIDALDAEWTSLALASRNVFATPEWARTWWKSFGGNRRP